jgi:hypothetical protein
MFNRNQALVLGLLSRVVNMRFESRRRALVVFFTCVAISGPALAKHVPAGGDLQEAINSALPGETITLEPGTIYAGNFRLPPKSGTDYVTITTLGVDTVIPPGSRVTPGLANSLARIVAKNDIPAFATLPGAHHYRLIGLEVFACANPQPGPERCPSDQGIYSNGLFDLGPSNANTVAQKAHDLVLDRLYIHGHPVVGGRRGIALNSRYTKILNSHISDFKHLNQDTQAIAGWNATRNVTIENNYLEASAQCIMFGGARPAIFSAVSLPTNIYIRRNHMRKPLAWKEGHPDYEGTKWAIKAIFELKVGVNVVLERNILENNWEQADQRAHAIVLTVRAEEPAMTWAKIESVKILYNLVRYSGAAINVAGRDGNRGFIGKVNDVVIRNNLFYGLDTEIWGGNGNLIQILLGPSKLTIDHNTFIQKRTVSGLDGGESPLFFPGLQNAALYPTKDLVFTNNIVHHGVKGIAGDRRPTAIDAFNTFAPGSYDFRKNLVMGTLGENYPGFNVNYFDPGDWAALGLDSDYKLSPDSPYKNAGTDGKALGADVKGLLAKLSIQLSRISAAPPASRDEGQPTSSIFKTGRPTRW